jgi:predicted regulator of Ras-like GTPase activity (Roadblock/LC7/MglB family)
MPLNAVDLSNDIVNDPAITGSMDADTLASFTTFAVRLAVHITEQIKRGSIDDVTVNTGSGNQTNTSMVK